MNDKDYFRFRWPLNLARTIPQLDQAEAKWKAFKAANNLSDDDPDIADLDRRCVGTRRFLNTPADPGYRPVKGPL